MLDLTKKYQTRDERFDVVHIHHAKNNARGCELITILRHRESGEVSSLCYYNDGRRREGVIHPMDLVPVPIKCIVYATYSGKEIYVPIDDTSTPCHSIDSRYFLTDKTVDVSEGTS